MLWLTVLEELLKLELELGGNGGELTLLKLEELLSELVLKLTVELELSLLRLEELELELVLKFIVEEELLLEELELWLESLLESLEVL